MLAISILESEFQYHLSDGRNEGTRGLAINGNTMRYKTVCEFPKAVIGLETKIGGKSTILIVTRTNQHIIHIRLIKQSMDFC